MTEKAGVEISTQNNGAVVAFRNPVVNNVEEIAAASQEICEFVDQDRPKKVVFDFERVKFFSSQVLGLLLDIRAKLNAYQGEVLISAINPQLHRVFKITNLDKIFKFVPDTRSAVKSSDQD
ncbi:MAG: STAS domain-containing protein [Planctomycetota bacterium]|jgi:anti-sigma B factor antagonist